MEKFRWCFIGVGGLSQTMARQILPSGRHEIVSCYRRNKEKNEEWAKKYGCKAYDSAKEAILDPKVDAVYVVTPHNSHFEYAHLALSLGKPVLVEKSFCVSAKEGRELVVYAKEKNLYIAEAMWTFFSPVARKVMEWVKENRLGKILKADARFNVFEKGVGRFVDPMRAGGALLDLGVYPITYFYRLFGMPKAIECQGYIKNGVDHHVHVDMVYDGFVARARAALDNLIIQDQATIEGETARMSSFMFHRGSKVVLRSKEGTEVFEGVTDYLNEFDIVANEIKMGKKESEYVPLKATLDVLSILDECRKQMGLVYPFEKN